MRTPLPSDYPTGQRGAAMMVMLVIMVLGALTFLVSALSSSALKTARQETTTAALAQAKDALIGFAVKVAISNSNIPNQARPGDLPCPDMDNDGDAESSCGSADGSTGQEKRLGRLPWKTLGLPDLRDGNGERLWYAVSNSFKNNTRSTAQLNSDTPGTITVRAPDGSLLNDGGGASGAVAVIFAPGAVLQRQGATLPQNRSCTIGIDCNATEKCTTTPATLTPKCDPVNYLDKATAEDNASFMDGSSTNGFIQGMITTHDPVTNTDYVILNDQLLVITRDSIMQSVQKRVAAEVKLCLNEYALNNNGRYPWPVPLTDLTSYQDNTDQLFGRIPDDLDNTKNDSGDVMDNKWGANCNTHNINTASTWWKSWREMVFYGLADASKPVDPPTIPLSIACTSPGACLSVNPPSSIADKKFVVIVAGKMLPFQANRPTNRSILSNYLEAPNSGGVTTFSQSSLSETFNDAVVFQ